VDTRSDIFSFGIVLYEMVTGRSPFKGQSQIETLAAILHEPVPPAAGFNAEVPARLEEVLSKCLEKDPGRRYQSNRDLVVDLKRLGRDLELGAVSSCVPVRAARPLPRRPWRVAALVAAAVVVGGGALLMLRPDRPASVPARPAHERSELAVLPFENLSAEEAQLYFAGGLHDELLTQLSKVAALKVISRTSVMGYQGTTKPLKQIAQELGVGSVVEGSVQVLGDRLRVNVQLIDATTDEHLWAERYDRTLDDAFEIQSEVAQQIVAAVGAALTDAERGRLTAVPTPNAEAYQLCLKGWFFTRKNAEKETQKGIGYFLRALKLDPVYADAHAGLAVAYYSLPSYGDVPPDSAYPVAREHALEAVRLDPSSARANEALGRLNMTEWHWEESARNFKQAIEADPSSERANDNYAFVLLFQGRTEEAVAQMRHVVVLDPLSVIAHQNLGEVLYYARRFDESIAASLEAIDMDPTFPQAHLFLGMAYAAQGKRQEAVKALDRDREISGGEKPEIDSWLAVGYALAGERERARQIYADMLTQQRSRFVSPFPLACICFVLGDVDRGFEWLSEGYTQRDHRMSYLKVHPACDGVRNDPRYLYWLKKMGLDS
jgi:TolB-like protein/Tfp pilus assembly protein PilF